MTLEQSSRPVGKNCIVFCNRQANLYLGCTDAVLVRVQTPDGKYHFLWQSAAKRDTLEELYPAFCEDMTITYTVAIKHQIALDEIFCYNGECYYLAKSGIGTQSIRLINLYSSQKIVEQIASYDSSPNPIKDVYLERVYKLGASKQLATVAWFVARGNFCDQIPVLEEDAKGFRELLRGLHVNEKVAVGECVSLQGKIYILQQDKNGKLYLAQSKMKLLKLNTSSV